VNSSPGKETPGKETAMRPAAKPMDGVPPTRTAGRRTVAVLGAGGLMGGAIAANLTRAGMNVRAWNRSRVRADPLTALGARVFSTPAKAARGADTVVTILADIDAVMEAMDGPAGGLAEMSREAIWLQMSTIGEAGTSQCLALAERLGVGFVDAPVLGSRQPAEQGGLIVLASGPEPLRARLQPIFDVLGERTMWLGDAGAGTKLKLALNAWVLTVVEAGAEIIALAQACGIDPRRIFEALAGGSLDLPYLRMKGMTMIERQFEPAFRLALAAKDAALVLDATKARGLDLPLIQVISERLAQGAKEHPDLDISATYLTITRLASLAER
jgi:3-hydroxyisobutyrate dehydrogenase